MPPAYCSMLSHSTGLVPEEEEAHLGAKTVCILLFYQKRQAVQHQHRHHHPPPSCHRWRVRPDMR